MSPEDFKKFQQAGASSEQGVEPVNGAGTSMPVNTGQVTGNQGGSGTIKPSTMNDNPMASQYTPNPAHQQPGDIISNSVSDALSPETAIGEAANNGTAYQPGGSANPENMKRYDESGQPLFGIPGAPRTMQKLDDKGNKSTEFVMPPDLADNTGNNPLWDGIQGALMPATGGLAIPTGNKTLDDLGRNIERGGVRAAAYGSTQALKGVVGFGEWLLKSAEKLNFGTAGEGEIAANKKANDAAGFSEKNPNEGINNPLAYVAKQADKLLNTTFSDTAHNNTDEQFPTMPATNNVERMIGTIGSMIWGGGAGKKVAETVAGDAPGFLLKAGEKFFNIAKQVDPANAKSKTEMFLKAAAVAMPGEAAGYTVVGPRHTASLTGNTFMDNLLLTYGGGVIGGAVKGVGGFINKKVLGSFSNGSDNPNNILRAFMERVDPMSKGADDAELAKRAQILGSIADANSVFKTGLTDVINGDVKLDTLGSLAMSSGAKDYYKQAYSHMYEGMDAAAIDAQAENSAQDLLENLRSFKKSRIQGGSTEVEKYNTNLHAQTQNMLTEKADNIMDEPFVKQNMDNLATQTVVNPLQDARNTLASSRANKEFADATLQNEQQSNALTPLLEQAKANNVLGSTSAEKATLNNMGANQLVQAWQKAHDTVEKGYANIRPGTQYDANGLANTVIGLHDQQNALDTLLISTPKAIKAPPAAIPGTEETPAVSSAQQLAESIQQQFPDTRSLINNAIPLLSKRIAAGFSKDAGKAVEPGIEDLVALRSAIYDIAGRDTDPTVQAAIANYKKFGDTWLQTPELKAFNDEMSQVHDMGPGLTQNNIIPAKTAGIDAINKIIVSDPTGMKYPKLIEALSGVNANAPNDIKQAYLGIAIQKMATNVGVGEPINSARLSAALSPMLDVLDTVDTSIRSDFNTALTALQAAEKGSVDADKALTTTLTMANKRVAEAADKAASKFVTDIQNTTSGVGEGPKLSTNPRAVFDQIFSGKEAIGTVQKLMAEADKAQNPLVKQGIRSQFLRWLKDKNYSSNAIGTTFNEGEVGFPTAPKMGSLGAIFNSSRDNTQNLIQAVFDGSPGDANAVTKLLKLVNDTANLDTAQTFVKGSNTARNVVSAQQGIQTIVKAVYGPLTRMGTRINTLGKLIFGDREATQQEIAAKMLDLMIVDPQFITTTTRLAKAAQDGNAFTRYVKGVVNATGPTVIGGVGAVKDQLFKQPPNQKIGTQGFTQRPQSVNVEDKTSPAARNQTRQDYNQDTWGDAWDNMSNNPATYKK